MRTFLRAVGFVLILLGPSVGSLSDTAPSSWERVTNWTPKTRNDAAKFLFWPTYQQTNFTCEQDGIFQDGTNCELFYVCVQIAANKFKRHAYRCNDDRVFSIKVKSCVKPEDNDRPECVEYVNKGKRMDAEKIEDKIRRNAHPVAEKINRVKEDEGEKKYRNEVEKKSDHSGKSGDKNEGSSSYKIEADNKVDDNKIDFVLEPWTRSKREIDESIAAGNFGRGPRLKRFSLDNLFDDGCASDDSDGDASKCIDDTISDESAPPPTPPQPPPTTPPPLEFSDSTEISQNSLDPSDDPRDDSEDAVKPFELFPGWIVKPSGISLKPLPNWTIKPSAVRNTFKWPDSDEVSQSPEKSSEDPQGDSKATTKPIKQFSEWTVKPDDIQETSESDSPKIPESTEAPSVSESSDENLMNTKGPILSLSHTKSPVLRDSTPKPSILDDGQATGTKEELDSSQALTTDSTPKSDVTQDTGKETVDTKEETDSSQTLTTDSTPKSDVTRDTGKETIDTKEETDSSQALTTDSTPKSDVTRDTGKETIDTKEETDSSQALTTDSTPKSDVTQDTGEETTGTKEETDEVQALRPGSTAKPSIGKEVSGETKEELDSSQASTTDSTPRSDVTRVTGEETIGTKEETDSEQVLTPGSTPKPSILDDGQATGTKEELDSSQALTTDSTPKSDVTEDTGEETTGTKEETDQVQALRPGSTAKPSIGKEVSGETKEESDAIQESSSESTAELDDSKLTPGKPQLAVEAHSCNRTNLLPTDIQNLIDVFLQHRILVPNKDYTMGELNKKLGKFSDVLVDLIRSVGYGTGSDGSIQIPSVIAPGNGSVSAHESCTQSGYFPNSVDCSKFYRCVPFGSRYLRHDFQCRDGTIWDPRINTCNFPANVPANGTCTRPSYGIQRQTNYPYEHSLKPTCLHCPSGIHRHPEYCNVFYQCKVDEHLRTDLQTFACPPGMIFAEDDKGRFGCFSKLVVDKTDDCIYFEHQGKSISIFHLKPEYACKKPGIFTLGRELTATYIECVELDNGYLGAYLHTCPPNKLLLSGQQECLEPKELSLLV